MMRVVSINNADRTFTTKGDNNEGLLSCQQNLSEDSIHSKVVGKIPYFGYLEFYYVGWLLRVILVYLISCLIVFLYNKYKK